MSICDPTTSAGRRLAFSAFARSRKPSGSGATSRLTRRAGAGIASAPQSSTGIDTKVGPCGACMAVWWARAIAAGTSSARAGSQLHFT